MRRHTLELKIIFMPDIEHYVKEKIKTIFCMKIPNMRHICF
jgi:hypothetical protein